MMSFSIDQIQKSDLCTGCGTCAGICPQDAIRMEKSYAGLYSPCVDTQKCNECSICLAVCPGYSIDFIRLNEYLFDKREVDVLLGNFIQCYLGYSMDDELRRNGSSGGLVTALLILALEENMIDGAIVTVTNKNSPLEPKVVIAHTREEVIDASRSKYCPVSVNTALKEIEKRDGKYAVVGLPCHIHGIRKVESINKIIKKRILLHLGLFCHHSVNFTGTEFLLQKIGVQNEAVKSIDYRGNGWPGGMTIKLRNSSQKFIPWKVYWDCIFGLYFFCPVRCTMCNDATNELADISFGDAWLHELGGSKEGVSVAISRTDLGQEVLLDAQKLRKVKLSGLSRNDLVRSQHAALRFKKKQLGKRVFILSKFGRRTPNYIMSPLRLDNRIVCSTILPYLNIWISSKKTLRSILKYVPIFILKICGILFSFLMKI